MARADADRNLLLGILAQQMDFVSRDALFEAMNAWIIRKGTPLGALLVERGDLARSRRDLLEALVDEHVKAHGGDPARSLQALSSVGPVAEALQSLADTDLQASVGYLRSMGPVPPSLDLYATRPATLLDQESADPNATRALGPQGQPSSWNGRFRVVRPHASGGLGVVSVALDNELDREVAFKEIKDKYADDRGSQARFVLEAEITGKLEHPGIIPIYGLGTDPSGRPFYAMRFIRGDSFADAINRYHDPAGPYLDPTKRSLQLRELLGRFLDVCDALAYAHSRGVLHRDLKPGNIMLGPFGETLVVDWGLALPLDRMPEGHDSTYVPVKATKTDSASLPREQGQVVGTPAYMPPEQAEGSIDKLGPRSDVYGLGAILYDLLTGKSPVEGTSLAEVLRNVNRGEIRSPRQVRPEIPAALEAVCLKSLSLKPDDRYATPRALAADIKAWLADEPVSARREPFAERARRWAKRNRTAVTAAAAAILVGLVGLGAVVAVLIASNIALDVQRLRAENREALAIDAVKKFRDAVADEPDLMNTPALDSLRKRLLKEPLAFFRDLRNRLQADRETRPESLTRLAEASFNLGRLSDEIGDKQDAIASIREALAIYQKLADAHPSIIEFQRDLAVSHNFVGKLLSETGKPAEALGALQSALVLRRKLAEANPAVSQFESQLASSYGNIGLLLRDTGHPAEALKAYESALTLQRKLVETNPAVTQFKRDLAASHNNIGILLRSIGRPTEALSAYESALTLQRKLVETDPTVTQFKRDLAFSHNEIGVLLSETGKPTEALGALQSALALRQKLAEVNPAFTTIQRDLAVSHISIGNILSATGIPAEALLAYMAALAIQQKLVEDNPTVSQFQGDLAGSHLSIGNMLIDTGKPAEALRSYESALMLQRKLVEANPAVLQFQSDVAASHNNIGLLLRSIGKAAEALRAYESALAIRQRLSQEHPDIIDLMSDLGQTLSNLGMIDLDAKRFEAARVRLRQAIECQRKALGLNPANSTYRQLLDNHLVCLIQAERGLNNSGSVIKAEHELAELRDSDPMMVALDARLSAILRGDQKPGDNSERLKLARRAYDKSIHALAATLWADALDTDTKLAGDRQIQVRYNAACAAALAGCGQGKDDPAPDEAARARLREQARGWLVAELAVWAKLVESGPAQARAFVVQTLQHWQGDSDLAGVREAKALEGLPETERKAWQVLWAEVAALLARASKP